MPRHTPVLGVGNDRYVGAHRLTVPWEEGNGRNLGQSNRDKLRGFGPGVTWNCAIDAEVSNSRPDSDSRWNGGWLAAIEVPTAVALHVNGMTGEVTWDVTADILAVLSMGEAEVSWLVKLENEKLSGKVIYYSKEGAVDAGDPTVAPRLILEYLR